jgi:hypothetical protein
MLFFPKSVIGHHSESANGNTLLFVVCQSVVVSSLGLLPTGAGFEHCFCVDEANVFRRNEKGFVQGGLSSTVVSTSTEASRKHKSSI